MGEENNNLPIIVVTSLGKAALELAGLKSEDILYDNSNVDYVKESLMKIPYNDLLSISVVNELIVGCVNENIKTYQLKENNSIDKNTNIELPTQSDLVQCIRWKTIRETNSDIVKVFYDSFMDVSYSSENSVKYDLSIVDKKIVITLKDSFIQDLDINIASLRNGLVKLIINDSNSFRNKGFDSKLFAKYVSHLTAYR